jgi:DNA-binding LytR/AlgR family response regulator
LVENAVRHGLEPQVEGGNVTVQARREGEQLVLSVVGIARHGHEAAAQGIEGPTRLVFVTAYDGYAVQTFDAAALDYLLKPVTAERLARSVGELVHQIPIEEVLFFNADKKCICVHTATGEFLIRTPLVELAGTRRDDTSRLWPGPRGHDSECR